MRLMATTNAMVTYPDRAAGGISCIELRSASHHHGHHVLHDEILALSAASLLIQLELGMPVVKLINLTDVVWGADDGAPTGELAEPILNCLGMYASDKADFLPQNSVKAALAHAPGEVAERFAAAPGTLDRIFRFIGAVGAADADGALLSPWVHVSLDRSAVDDGRSEVVRRAALSPSLVSQALWWQPHVSPDADRLFRSSHPREEGAFDETDQVLVPLPFARAHEASAPAADTTERAIRSVDGVPSAIGFSLISPFDPEADVATHGSTLIRSTLEATARFIDRQTAAAPSA